MTLFDRTGALSEIRSTDESTLFVLDIDPSWSSLRGVHGGYLASLAVRAAQHLVPDRTVRTSTTSFLRPAAVGSTQVEIVPERVGRSLSTHVVTISQAGRTVATTRVTTVAPVEGLDWERPDPVVMAPLEDCVPVDPPEGVRHFEHATASLDPAHLPFAHGEFAQVGGYVRPLEPRPIDAAWLTMILDWFPPSPFSQIDPPTGGVSVDYTVHLHRTRPTPGPDEWLTGLFRADISAEAMALEKGTIRDPAGHVLAESFHTRWTARQIS
ncbi:thioesterase family protein [soil metagenome]